jgi:hypothetical protein
MVTALLLSDSMNTPHNARATAIINIGSGIGRSSS